MLYTVQYYFTYSYAICMYSYVTRMCSHDISMSLVCHLYVSRMYSCLYKNLIEKYSNMYIFPFNFFCWHNIYTSADAAVLGLLKSNNTWAKDFVLLLEPIQGKLAL